MFFDNPVLNPCLYSPNHVLILKDFFSNDCLNPPTTLFLDLLNQLNLMTLNSVQKSLWHIAVIGQTCAYCDLFLARLFEQPEFYKSSLLPRMSLFGKDWPDFCMTPLLPRMSVFG